MQNQLKNKLDGSHLEDKWSLHAYSGQTTQRRAIRLLRGNQQFFNGRQRQIIGCSGKIYFPGFCFTPGTISPALKQIRTMAFSLRRPYHCAF